MHSAICLLALLLCGCANSGRPAEGVKADSNFEFTLIAETAEGVKVYRFRDVGRYHYLAVKGDSVSLTSQ